MADTVQVLDHRYPGLGTDPLYQALAAAGYDHVDVVGHGNETPYRRPIRRVHHLDGGLRQPGGPQALGQAVGDGAVGGQGLGTAAQNCRIA